MRVIVCGSAPRRDRPGWSDRGLLFKTLDILARNATTIVEGEAEGADVMARQWARERGVAVEPFRADWKRLGRGAGMVRNRAMIETVPDMVVAFTVTLPPTAGTAGMLGLAVERRVPVVWVVTPDGRMRSYAEAVAA